MTFDVLFSPGGIHIRDCGDEGDRVVDVILPHIAASRAMAEGNYEVEHQERDIKAHLLRYGYSLQGLYTRDPVAVKNS